MENHVKAVGIIHIAFSVLGVIMGVVVFTVLNLVARMPDVDEEAIRILQTIGFVVPWFIIILLGSAVTSSLYTVYLAVSTAEPVLTQSGDES